MNVSTQELIIPHNRQSLKKTLAVVLIMASISIDIILGRYRTAVMPGKIVLGSVLVVLLIFFTVRFFQFYKEYKNREPVAILNQQGIWMKAYGLIPWDNVAAVEEFYAPMSPAFIGSGAQCLGIRLRYTSDADRNASRLGKAILSMGERSKYGYHITFINGVSVDVNYAEVIGFAQYYMGKSTMIEDQGAHQLAAPHAQKMLFASHITTPLGQMLAIADMEALYLLEFTDCRGFDNEIAQLKEKTGAIIAPGKTKILISIEQELQHYFAGTLREFKTPIALLGTPFQHAVWTTLQKIPFGNTGSYAQVACAIGMPTAFRAVANANGKNRLAIIIPCHRIIKRSGDLCGYNGGLMRKQWLINHEKNLVRPS